jgi:hypothetical protein
MTAPPSEQGHEPGQTAQVDPEPGQIAQADQEPATGTVESESRTAAEPAGAAEPAAAGPGQFLRGLRVSSPALQGTLALAIFLCVWLLGWTVPLLQHPHLTMLDQDSMDPNFYVWSLRWWPYALSHGLNPLISKQIGAPAGFNMTWTTTIPPLAILAWPLTLIMGALPTYNVLTVIAAPLAAWAAFIACRRLTGRFWAALLGAACYGFSSYETGHTVAGQLNLTWSLLPPLMLYLILRWRDRELSRGWFIGLMALTLLLQFFLFNETFFEVTAVLGIGLPVGYAVAGRAGRPTVARLARHVSLAWLIAMALASPYVVYALSNYPHGFSRSPATTGLNLASTAVPRPTGALGIPWLAHYARWLPPGSEAGYIGVPALVIIVGLAIYTWHSKMTRFVVIMLVIIVALAVGPVLVIGTLHVGSVPWSKLWYLPVARSALPNRFMLLGLLAVAVIVALWASLPMRTLALRGARSGVALLAVVAFFANVPPLPFDPGAARDHLPAFFTTGEYHHYLKPGETVVVVSKRGNAGMLFQAYTNFYMKVAGGYINMALTPGSDLPEDVIALAQADPARDARFLAYLKHADIKAIIVERDWIPLWAGIFRRLGLKGKAVGGVFIYRIK